MANLVMKKSSQKWLLYSKNNAIVTSNVYSNFEALNMIILEVQSIYLQNSVKAPYGPKTYSSISREIYTQIFRKS